MSKKPINPEELIKETGIKFPSAKKQKSIHSTFRLSAEAHEAIKELSTVYGKHADIFDEFAEGLKTRVEIYENIQQLPKNELPPSFKTSEALAIEICFPGFAEKLKKIEKRQKIRKTYVLRKEAIEIIEKYKNELKKAKIIINRDSLIEYITLTFKEALDKNKAESTVRYKSYLNEIETIWNELETLEGKVRSELGTYDPFDLIGRIGYETCGLMNLQQDLEAFLQEEAEK